MDMLTNKCRFLHRVTEIKELHVHFFFFYKAPFGQNKVIFLQKQITQMSEQVLIYATTFHLKHFHHHQHHDQTEKHRKQFPVTSSCHSVHDRLS